MIAGEIIAVLDAGPLIHLDELEALYRERQHETLVLKYEPPRKKH